jgi:prolyl 4-hydroxylase
MQGQRYHVGQQYRHHHDFFHGSDRAVAAEAARGGQRTWTAMIFLNVPEEGGQTNFPAAGVKVTPRAGNLLIWNNMDSAGHPNLYSLHQGSPVLAGTKYVITKWHRERPWKALPAAPY